MFVFASFICSDIPQTLQLSKPTKIKTFSSIQPPHFFHSTSIRFCIRTQVPFATKVFFCQAKSGTNESLNVKGFPPTLLAAEKEEAKAVLTLFLKKQGLSNANAARIINKSDPFIDHLLSKLHSKHKTWYLSGRELTTLEIRDALISYLESLFEEHGNVLIDVVENYPNPPVKDKSSVPITPPNPSAVVDSKKLKAVSTVSGIDPAAGNLRPHIVYLMELGMDSDQIRIIMRRFPAFAYYSLEGKIKPLVEFFLELGVPKEQIPIILTKRPQLCGISLSENLKPTMKFFESLGVDKKQWAKVIYRFPALLTYSRQKIIESVDFLRELGISDESIGKILTRYPNIVSYSVEDNLRPTATYFRSLGVDVGAFLFRCPQTFGLSIEANIKPVTKFFLERGYTVEEIGTMITRYGMLYTFSLTENMIPKWDYFMTMDYPKSELVKFPQYFGYSLEQRIKPRYARVKEAGVRLLLNQTLSLSSSNFEEVLKKKIKKLQVG
ncbi:Mitochondrial transcription termination factor family protein [Trifolium repens]|nr:Mitochondrial transcription termination factor family protein [Trifolium repens]